MIVSIDWLSEFLEIKESPNELADILSNSGLEAELNEVPLSIPGVIIGKVESTEKHPDADKLKICIVNDGRQNHQVICGASNVNSGQMIPFATVGSILPGNLKIKKAKIRGVESDGMICSERELNISDEHEGIMVLPHGLPLGKDFMEAYGKKFLSLELDVTPNRPDAFSHQGVARDLACITDRKFSPVFTEPRKVKGNESLKITMESSEDCPRYIGGIIKGVSIGPSPDWLVDRLRSVGQRSINNIVDISNFVLMEMGHPTHIFDYDKLDNKEIYVRRANEDESLITLDEQKHKLKDNHLLITDGDNPIALAGIMGGLSTAVNEGTKNLLVESAYFNPVTIRKGAKDLSMSTDASKRYERGADPNGCDAAFWRVVSLIEDLTGGELVSDAIDVYVEKINKQKIAMRKEKLELVLGITIENEIISRIFDGLGIQNDFKDDNWTCLVPTYRPDITREIDLIEEVARIYGFENIPPDYSLNGIFRFDNPDPEKFLDYIRQTLVGLGFHQVYSNSLQNEKEAGLTNNKPVGMMNPLNKEMGFLRTSLIPGLIKAADMNIKNSNNQFRIFELGHVHLLSESSLNGVDERKLLSGLIIGNIISENVHTDLEAEDLFSVKGYLSSLFENKLSMRMELDIENEDLGFELSRSITLNKQKVGRMGRISTAWIDSMNLDLEEAYGFEIDLEPIKGMLENKKTFKKIVPYPKVMRDLNLVIPEEQEVGSILEIFHKYGKKLITRSEAVNVFKEKESIGEGVKSVTFSLTFQDPSKTLEDKDVNPIIDEIIRVAEKTFNAKLRV